MQAYVTIAQSCGDASSQFSHVLTEIIFVEIVFWQQVVGIVTAGRMLGLFVLKPSQYGTFLFFVRLKSFLTWIYRGRKK